MAATLHGVGGFTTVATIVGTALTTAYTGNRYTLDLHGSEHVVFLVNYTKGGETSLQVQVEVWDADTGWWIVPANAATMAVETTDAASDTIRLVVRDLSPFETQARISAKSTGSANGTTNVVILANLRAPRLPIS